MTLNSILSQPGFEGEPVKSGTKLIAHQENEQYGVSAWTTYNDQQNEFRVYVRTPSSNPGGGWLFRGSSEEVRRRAVDWMNYEFLRLLDSYIIKRLEERVTHLERLAALAGQLWGNLEVEFLEPLAHHYNAEDEAEHIAPLRAVIYDLAPDVAIKWSASIIYKSAGGVKNASFVISRPVVTELEVIEILKNNWLDSSTYRWHNDPYFSVVKVDLHRMEKN